MAEKQQEGSTELTVGRKKTGQQFGHSQFEKLRKFDF